MDEPQVFLTKIIRQVKIFRRWKANSCITAIGQFDNSIKPVLFGAPDVFVPNLVAGRIEFYDPAIITTVVITDLPGVGNGESSYQIIAIVQWYDGKGAVFGIPAKVFTPHQVAVHVYPDQPIIITSKIGRYIPIGGIGSTWNDGATIRS